MRIVHAVTLWKSMVWNCWKCQKLTKGYVETYDGPYQYMYNYPCGHPHSTVDVDPSLSDAELALARLMEET